MDNKIFAVIIGSVSDYGKDRFIVDPNKSKQANWLIKRATENGFFFETEEKSLVFINEVTEFAKKLYADKQREKVEQEREQMIAEREQKYKEWLKKE